MRKKLIIALLGVSLITPVIAAKAESDSWWLNGTNTKITGTLYFYNDDKEQANAKTVNNSGNGVRVKTKIYAQSGGTTIPGSWRESTGYPEAWISSAARRPDWWGSGHTTTPTPDPVKWLSLYAG